MRVVILGLRGFPDVQGGVETHAAHLCPLLVELGCQVHVISRAPYHPATMGKAWRGVQFHRIWAPKSKGLEAIVHTLLGVLYAGLVLRPDILHIQAIGPAIMTPFARLFGLRVVVTHHGPDYDRQKWGKFAKAALRLGERLGMRWSQGRIVISEGIRRMVWKKHQCDSTLIPNGVTLPRFVETSEMLGDFGLESGKYVVLVSRLVPEKRHLDLIAAFRMAALPGWKLAIVGASDHPDAYVQRVLDAAQQTPDVVCTGFQSGEKLAELFGHAGLFVLPSSHEGLPIALLEALSYGLPVIASDISANLEVGLPQEHYFPLGDVAALAARLLSVSTLPLTPSVKEARRHWVAQRYDWQRIARQTVDAYRDALKRA